MNDTRSGMEGETMVQPANATEVDAVVEDVEIRGHIIDSLIFPKILDCIIAGGGSFRIKKICIGQTRSDSSYALVEVRAADAPMLVRILGQIADHGAVPVAGGESWTVAADLDGAFPEGFYSTSNERSEFRLDGCWIPGENLEMDCGFVVERSTRSARCVPMSDVRKGDKILVGYTGVRVFPEERSGDAATFAFMGSTVSTEKPKAIAIRNIAQHLSVNRFGKGKTAIVAGPAIIHTGSGPYLEELIRSGYVDLLLAGNALATHDIEQAMFGTSLGAYLEREGLAEAGHEHHLRAINRIRRAGGIRRAAECGILPSGIMYECVHCGVDFLLAGSIRDDGPLPEVMTDVLEAQRKMREKLHGVGFCLMIATALHSIAVGNLLPAWVKVVCVDINPSTAIKLSDRGSFQTVSLVTDVAPFLRALVEELAVLDVPTTPRR